MLENRNNTKYYDWANKITFVLDASLLDKFLIYLKDYDSFSGKIEIKNKDKQFSLTNGDNSDTFIYNISDNTSNIFGEITFSFLFGLRILLNQAKLKIYGWN